MVIGIITLLMGRKGLAGCSSARGSETHPETFPDFFIFFLTSERAWVVWGQSGKSGALRQEPGHERPAHPQDTAQRRFVSPCAVLLWVVFPVLAGCNGERPIVPSTGSGELAGPYGRAPKGLLTPDPVVTDLGRVRQRAKRQRTIQLRNDTSDPVTIVRLTSSCDCLIVRLKSLSTESEGSSVTVAAGETVAADVELDLSREPEFVGMLGMHVRGYTATGALALAFVVDAEVVAVDGRAER